MLPKKAIRSTLRRFGYVVRGVGGADSVAGVDMLHDVRVLLGGEQGLTLFDVGANVGQTVTSFLEVFAAPRIFSFEPSPETFKQLAQCHGGRPNVRLENQALGESEGVLPFFVNGADSVNDSLLQPTWNQSANQVPVQVRTLDGYCAAAGIPRIDFLKIDTQGYDLNVLRGARQMLREKRVRTYCVEITFVSMYKDQSSFRDYVSFAEEVGYRLVGLYEQTYLKNDLWYCNACFKA